MSIRQQHHHYWINAFVPRYLCINQNVLWRYNIVNFWYLFLWAGVLILVEKHMMLGDGDEYPDPWLNREMDSRGMGGIWSKVKEKVRR